MKPTYAYLCRAACGCYQHAMVDDPAMMTVLAAELRAARADGMTVDRLPLSEVFACWLMTPPCPHRDWDAPRR